jgi:subtilisin family serine protease
MKKRFSIIIGLVVLLTFIISGCMNLNLSDVINNNTSEADFSGYESYLPPFKELSGRKFNNDELVVGCEENADLDEILENFNGATIEREIPALNAVLLKLDTDVMDVEKAFKILKGKKIDGIRYVEPNYTDREIPVIKNTDSNTQKETGSSALNQVEVYPNYKDKQYALKKIGAESAWEKATGEGVIVGLLDTGTDGTHPDLVDQLVEGYDPYWNKKIDPKEDSDTDGHGTHTAGIIAAKDDGHGVVGLAPEAKIMPIRIFNPDYVGDAAVAAGIVWAVDHEADVLSNSWGGGGYSNILKDAFDYALKHDVVVVASSGNDTTDQFWHYPSAYTGVIGVAASDANDKITSFSSRGEYISVAAPGNNVISSIPVRLGQYMGVEGEPYAYWAGTSMACPYVSALAALIKEEYPNANVYQIKKMIEVGAEDIEQDGFDTSAGYGRISSASLNLDPNDYKAGALVVEAVSERGGYYLPGVNVTLENRDTGKRYYGKTNDYGYELFAGIEPGDYEVIIGGPEYLYYNAPNYRMEEELSYSGVIEVGDETTYKQEFETAEFELTLGTFDTFGGTLTISLKNSLDETVTNFNLLSESATSTNLLAAIDEKGHDYYPYFLTYQYEQADGEDDISIYVEGEVSMNGYPIPVFFEVTPDSTIGFIDEYGGYGLWWTVY